MASGHLCLHITEKINWEEFPEYAAMLLKFLNGKTMYKADAPDIRVWDVLINKKKYRLVFDDYPVMVSLESDDDEADNGIKAIREILLMLKKKKQK